MFCVIRKPCAHKHENDSLCICDKGYTSYNCMAARLGCIKYNLDFKIVYI